VLGLAPSDIPDPNDKEERSLAQRDAKLSFQLGLNVAGVGIRICSEAYLGDQYEPCYRSFLEESLVSGEPSVEIAVLTEPCPENDSPLTFESGGAWNMRPEADGYRLSFHREGTELCHTVACSDADTTHVTVYVDLDVPPSERTLKPPASPVCYPLDQLLLMNHLSARGGVVVHAAAAVVGGKALVFPGVSGAGKSTLSRLFVDGGFGASLLSDDRVIVRAKRDLTNAAAGRREQVEDCQVWGTPWPGDARIAANEHAPLGALFFLVKSRSNGIVPLDTKTAVKRLFPMVTCPWYDLDRLPGVLDTCARLVGACPCFELHFRPDGGIVSLLAGGSWS
jgi:hypothetical protein